MDELPENPHKCTGFCKAVPSMLFSYGLREEDRRYHAWEDLKKQYAGYLSPEEVGKLKSQLAAANTTIEGLTLAIAEAVKAERERVIQLLNSIHNNDIHLAVQTEREGMRGWGWWSCRIPEHNQQKDTAQHACPECWKAKMEG